MPRRFLRLTRAHTVPLETVPAIVGASLASGTMWSTEVGLWGVFGVLYHLSGYGMNSYTDWKNGFDKEDEWKQHHPLNSGSISPEMAKVTVFALLALTVTYSVWLVYPSVLGTVLLTLAITSGVIYNELGKETKWKFLFICFAHTSVFAIPYVSLGGEVTSVFLAGVLYVFVWVMYQISVSGEVKDMETDEQNFMKSMGAAMAGDMAVFPDECRRYGYFLKSSNIFLASAVMFYYGTGLLAIYIVAIVGVLTLLLNRSLLRTATYTRSGRIEDMSMIEMFTLTIFCLMFITPLGGIESWSLIIVSGVWVIAGNKAIWDTWIAPKV